MDADLFPAKPHEPRRPEFWVEVAKRKVGDPKWEWFSSERIGDGDFLMEGGEPRTISKGPRKGHRTWKHLAPHEKKKVVVTQAEIQQAEADYERDTGKCNVCGGSGQEWRGWSRDNGDRFRPCLRCDATGAAPKDSSA